ncbi:MAG TPA: ABC transporter substrate-binding protein [Sedimentibacter sp.]|nr:ABC transporter substrate-binding protein [Sedimentibacter sp.]HQB64229.1 ABC transporter substrate-binding protein [Sedimentibacter sp.]
MKRKSILVLTLICIMALLPGCTGTGEAKPPQSEEQNTKLPATDRAGNEISIPDQINRIISISPANTEILIELGFADKIIAADEYSKDIKGLPKGIPLFDMMAPDAEQMVALEPDIIYTTGMVLAEGNDPYKPIKDMGICVAYVPASISIEGIYEDILFLAKSLGADSKGADLVNSMISKIEEIEEKGKTIENNKTVYFELAESPNLYSFGTGVFLNEMIEIIGAENVLADYDMWISISEENVIASNPDVIITNVDYIENPVDEIKSRSGWENVKAVKSDQVYYVDNYATSHPNHNIIIGLEQMAKAIYPDLYK